jgi:hypothetical protein
MHGLTALKRTVRIHGSRAIDGRTTLAKTLGAWRAQLIADLGGHDSLSIQETALVDLTVRTKLLLDSVDEWLLRQHSLVNMRKRALLPVVRERTQLADALARYLAMLGLTRRPKPVPSLEDYLASRRGNEGIPEDGLSCEVRTSDRSLSGHDRGTAKNDHHESADAVPE